MTPLHNVEGTAFSSLYTPLHFDFLHFYSILALSFAHKRCMLYIPPLSASFVAKSNFYFFSYHESVGKGNSSGAAASCGEGEASDDFV